jgi:NAD(P)-dependent dehydrogenase (short-subunit alcohol dehydrogenase family)
VLARDGSAAPLDKFTKVISVNLTGAYNVIRIVAAQMASQELRGETRGAIVNVASVAAFEGQVGQVAYSASKGAIHAMTLPLARDLAKHAIRVNTIAPGVFLTPMMGTIPPAAVESLQRQVAFPKRLGRPEEFAASVMHLVANDYMNAETVRVDAGIRMASM